MPTPGHRWYHLVFHTRGSWLHGDPRGFRSRDHRVHSGGDYKQRPPTGEHDGLHDYMKGRSGNQIMIPADLRRVVGEVILAKTGKQSYRVFAICVGITHTHVLAELPDDYDGARRIVGTWKQASSHAVRAELPGQVWAEGGKPIEVNSRGHQNEVFGYIIDYVKEDAWVWTYKDGVIHDPAV